MLTRHSLLVYSALAGCCLMPAAFAQEGDAAPRGPKVPKVALSDQHKQMVKVQVGDEFPELSLPAAAQPSDPAKPLAEKFGGKATVIGVWQGDSPMGKAMLRDMSFDIAQQYSAAEGEPPVVSTVAISTGTDAGKTLEVTKQAEYDGTVLLDESGEASGQLGTERMPRVYVLDSTGKVVWLDIEYSLSTRREMKQAVAALAKK